MPTPDYLRELSLYAKHSIAPTSRIVRTVLCNDLAKFLDDVMMDTTINCVQVLSDAYLVLRLAHKNLEPDMWGSLHSYNNWLSRGCGSQPHKYILTDFNTAECEVCAFVKEG